MAKTEVSIALPIEFSEVCEVVNQDTVGTNGRHLFGSGGQFDIATGTFHTTYVGSKDRLSNFRGYQHTSSPWSIYQCVPDGSIDISSSLLTGYVITGIFVDKSGTRLYLLDNYNKRVYQFTMSTAWNITTLSYTGVSPAITTTNPKGITISDNGLNITIGGSVSGPSVQTFTLSSAWNITTMSTGSTSIAYFPQKSTAADTLEHVGFKSNGTKLYYLFYNGTDDYNYYVRVYDSSTNPWLAPNTSSYTNEYKLQLPSATCFQVAEYSNVIETYIEAQTANNVLYEYKPPLLESGTTNYFSASHQLPDAGVSIMKYFCTPTMFNWYAVSTVGVIYRIDPKWIQAPTITLDSYSATTITVDWSTVTGATGYKVYKDGTYLTTLGNVLTYTYTGLTTSVEYDLNITAIHSGRESYLSNTITQEAVNPNNPPSDVTGLSYSVVTTSSIDIYWNAATDDNAVIGYRVYNAAGTILNSAVTGGTSWNNTGLSAGTQYSYKIKAYDAEPLYSVNYSSTLYRYTLCIAPTLTAGTATDTSIVITRNSVTGGTTYTLYWRIQGGSWAVATTTMGTSYTKTGLNGGSTYEFYAIAKNPDGASSANSTSIFKTTTGGWTTFIMDDVGYSSSSSACAAIPFGEAFYHDGSGTHPVVNDIVSTSASGSPVFNGSNLWYKFPGQSNYALQINTSGVITSKVLC